jgi:deoxyguanosine kinase
VLKTNLTHIAVEGPIGVGKTTLTKRLAQSFDGETLLERPQDNPFLENFYADPTANALPTQLTFLLQRVQQIKVFEQQDMFAPVRVADFMLEKDRIFAELTLQPEELQLYEQVAQQLIKHCRAPDLVIYLQAPVEVLLDRVAHRGIPSESHMQAGYLESLVKAYTHFFYHYDAAPLVIVNAAEINLAEGDEDYLELLNQLKTIPKGRHYLNPLPF